MQDARARRAINVMILLSNSILEASRASCLGRWLPGGRHGLSLRWVCTAWRLLAGRLVDSSKGYWRLSLEGPLNGGTPSRALPPGGLGHVGEPEHGPGTKPRGMRGEARQVARAAERSQAHGAHCKGVRRAEALREPGRPPQGPGPRSLPAPAPGLRCVFTGEFHHRSGPSVLRCETGTLTKTSFGEWMDTYSVVHADHGILLSTKQK